MILNGFERSGFWLMVCMLIPFISGCSDEDLSGKNIESTACTIQMEDLYGTWVIDGVSIDPPLDLGNGLVTDIYSTWEDCKKDNTEQFLSNGDYQSGEGVIECKVPSQSSGNWVFDPQNCKVSITVDGQVTTVWHITSVSPSELRTKVNVIINGIGHVETRTYTRY